MTEDIRYNDIIQQTLCEVMNEERNSIRREKNRARLTQYIRRCGLNEDLLDDIEAPVETNTAQKVVSEQDYLFSLSFNYGFKIWDEIGYLKNIHKIPFESLMYKAEQMFENAHFIDNYKLTVELFSVDQLLYTFKNSPNQKNFDLDEFAGVDFNDKTGPHSWKQRTDEILDAKCDKPVREQSIALNVSVKFDPDDFKFKDIVKDFRQFQKVFDTLFYYLAQVVTVERATVYLFDFTEQKSQEIISRQLQSMQNGVIRNNLKSLFDMRYSDVWNIARRISKADMYKRAPEESMEDGQKYEAINGTEIPDCIRQMIINLATDDLYDWEIRGFSLLEPKPQISGNGIYIKVNGIKKANKNTYLNVKKHLEKAFTNFNKHQIQQMNVILKYQTTVFVVFDESVGMPVCNTDDPHKKMYDWIMEKNGLTFRFSILTPEFRQYPNNLYIEDPMNTECYMRGSQVTHCAHDEYYEKMADNIKKFSDYIKKGR